MVRKRCDVVVARDGKDQLAVGIQLLLVQKVTGVAKAAHSRSLSARNEKDETVIVEEPETLTKCLGTQIPDYLVEK